MREHTEYSLYQTNYISLTIRGRFSGRLKGSVVVSILKAAPDIAQNYGLPIP
jgi:hypothetical protein